MNDRQMAAMLEVLATSYPSTRWSEKVLKTWGSMLVDLDGPATHTVLVDWVKNEKFPPSIAELRERSTWEAERRRLGEVRGRQRVELVELTGLPTIRGPGAIQAVQKLTKSLEAKMTVPEEEKSPTPQLRASQRTPEQMRAAIEEWNEAEQSKGENDGAL